MSDSKALPIFIVKLKKEEPDGITIVKKDEQEYFSSEKDARTYMNELISKNIFWAHELEVKRMYKINNHMLTKKPNNQ